METDIFLDDEELSSEYTSSKENVYLKKYERWIGDNSFSKNLSSISKTGTEYSMSSKNVQDIKAKEYKEDKIKKEKDDNKKTAQNTESLSYTFIWNGEGNDVKLTGTFSNWEKKYQMKKDPNNNIFKLELPLEHKVYQYKFIIDGTWKFSEDCPMIDDGRGNINNILDFTACSSKAKEKEEEMMDKVLEQKKKQETNNVDEIIEHKTLRNDKQYNNIYPSDEDVIPSPLPNKKYYENFTLDYYSNQELIGNNKYCDNLNLKKDGTSKQILSFGHVNLNHLITMKKKKDKVRSNCIAFRYREKSSTIIYYK